MVKIWQMDSTIKPNKFYVLSASMALFYLWKMLKSLSFYSYILYSLTWFYNVAIPRQSLQNNLLKSQCDMALQKKKPWLIDRPKQTFSNGCTTFNDGRGRRIEWPWLLLCDGPMVRGGTDREMGENIIFVW